MFCDLVGGEVCMYHFEVGFALRGIVQPQKLLAWGSWVCGGALKKGLLIKICKQGSVVTQWTVIKVEDSAFAER